MVLFVWEPFGQFVGHHLATCGQVGPRKHMDEIQENIIGERCTGPFPDSPKQENRRVCKEGTSSHTEYHASNGWRIAIPACPC